MTLRKQETDCITSFRDRLVRQETSAREYIGEILEGIACASSPTNAFSSVYAKPAEHDATLVDRLVAQGKQVGLLAGVSVAVKDNIDTISGPCPSGLDLFANYRPQRDAKLVKLLRDSHAIIIGATRTDAGAFGVTTPTVTNPVHANRIVGGSSGGSAAAVAAGLCKVAIGTDTGGSLRIPAACCGVYGFKPTRGRVPLDGVRPLSDSFDHAGPIATCIEDLVAVMRVIDPDFEATGGSQINMPPVLGVPRNCFRDASEEVKAIFENFLGAARKLGCRVRDLVLPTPSEVLPVHLALSLYEAARHYQHLASDEMAALPKPAHDGITVGRKVTDSQCAEALEKQAGFVRQISAALETVDLIAMPTMPILPPERDSKDVILGPETVDILMALIRYTATFNQTGHPAIACPWQAASGDLPGSVQLIGQRNGDLRLLHFAKELGL